MNVNEYFAPFQLYLQICGLAKSSREAYSRTLRRFGDYLEYGNGPLETAEIRKEHICGFLAACEEAEEQRNTLVHRLLILKKFFGWLKEEGVTPENPTARIPVPREAKRIPRYLSPQQIEDLLAQADINTPWGLRDRALMELLYGSGLRISEALDLELQDIDYSQGFVYIRKGKGGNPRCVPMGKPAGEWLERYVLSGRRKLERDCSNLVFLTRNGDRMRRQTAAAAVREYAQVAGLPAWVTPHSLRHAAATHMLEGGARLSYIQELLGHKRINSTQIYMAVRSEGLKEVHGACHPRG